MISDLPVSAERRNVTPGLLLRIGNVNPDSNPGAVRARWQGRADGKIVLLQPRVGYMDSMRSKPALPLSLLHAASLAVEKHPVVIIDQRCNTDWRERLLRELADGPLLVGITCYTGPMIGRALEMARIVREHCPEVPILWGGVHVGLLPEQSLQHPLVDLVARGEGEATLARLADVLAGDGDLSQVPGLSFMDGDRYVATPAAPYVDVTTTPEIPYDLVKIEDYLPLYEGRRSLYMESSRGCPYACTYCYNVYFNDRRWRAQAPERVVERVQYVRDRYGVEDIYFTDDDFFINAKRSRAIVQLMGKIDVSWQVQGSDVVCISKMDDDFLQELQDSGFRRFTIGLETGSPRLRKQMKKEGSIDLILRTFERLAKYNFIIFGSFFSNSPGETLEDIRHTVDLIDKLHDINPHFRNSPVYLYTPFPGTPMFDQAVAAGFQPPTGLEGWGFSFEGDGERACIGTESLAFYERLYLATLFNDYKVEEYAVSPFTRVAAKMYRPIAKYRLKHLYFDYMPEVLISRRALRGA